MSRKPAFLLVTILSSSMSSEPHKLVDSLESSAMILSGLQSSLKLLELPDLGLLCLQSVKWRLYEVKGSDRGFSIAKFGIPS